MLLTIWEWAVWLWQFAWIIGAIAVYVAALLTRLPWLIAAPVMGLCVYMFASTASYRSGYEDAGKVWQQRVQTARQELDKARVEAARKIAAIEQAALDAETATDERERERALELHRLLESRSTAPTTNSEDRNNAKPNPCRCLDRVIPDGILRSIR